ncbi:MAG: glycosyltransferase [Gemmatimonadaceae bacterium]|nr:glycosyltransferase [Gemmatimonadaceae bacterium]
MSIRLSICIPTFNRAAFIGATLDSVLPQAGDDVEVVIVDGASVDDTEAIVRAYQRQHPRLVYEKRERNSGVERDTHRAVEIATGEFCWLMCSDDVLKPGAVDAVLGALAQGHEFVVVNAEVRNRDLSELLEERRLRVYEDRVYRADEMERLFLDTIDYLTYMGAVVIRRSLWMSRPNDEYLDTDFVHVGVIFQRELPGTSLAMAEPRMILRGGNATWTAREFELWSNWSIVVWSLKNFPEAIRQCICPQYIWLDLRKMVLQRACGTFSLKEYDRWIRPVSGWRRQKFLLRLLAVFPGGPLNLLNVIYFSLRGSRGSNLVALRASRFYWLRSGGSEPAPR